MTVSALFLVVIFTCLLIGNSNAIHCFTCEGTTPACAPGIMAQCPSVAPFCKLEWSATSDNVRQTCATGSDCPTLPSHLRKRQADQTAGSSSDINNCCNYDGCNCIGTQCEGIGGSGFRACAAEVVIILAEITVAVVALLF